METETQADKGTELRYTEAILNGANENARPSKLWGLTSRDLTT